MTSHCLRLSMVLFFILSANLPAAEIKGTVAEIQGESVSLMLDAELLPNVGDKVEIYIAIPGLDDVALVASGTVSQADGDLVLVQIEETPGKIEKSQLARISSAKPRMRTASPSSTPPKKPTPMPDEPADLPAGLSRLGEHDEVVGSIAVLSDGRQAISVAHGKQTHSWDLRTTPYVKGKHRLEHGRHIRFWDLRTGTELRQIEFGDETTLCCAVTPDGRRAAVGTSDGTVQLWDLEAGRVTSRLLGHTTWVGAVAISTSGRFVLSGAGEVGLGEGLGKPAPVRKDCTVRLWDVTTGRELARFEGHQGMIKSVAFSPDGGKVLSASTDRTTRLWNIGTGKEERRFIERRPLGVLKAVFSPDGKRILTSSGGAPEVEEDPQTLDGQPLERAPGQPGVPDFLPRTDEFGDETDTFALRLWDVASGQLVRSFHGHTQAMECVEFSPDGHRVLSGSSDRTVRLWDAESGETLAVFAGHEGAVSCVAFTPDGRRALSGSIDKTLRVWSLPK